MATPLDIGYWAYDAGFTAIADLTEAIAVAVATRSSVSSPAGLWGVGGTSNDGPSQARAAYERFRMAGWSSFPAAGSPLIPLTRPGAATVAATVVATRRGQQAVQAGRDAAGTAVDAATAPAQAAAQAARLARFISDPSTSVRAAKIVGGFLVIGAAVLMIFQGTVLSAGRTIVRTGSKIVTKGKGES